MIQNLTALISLASLLVMLYGVLQLVTWPTVQDCRMTYMFQYPQFTVSVLTLDLEAKTATTKSRGVLAY